MTPQRAIADMVGREVLFQQRTPAKQGDVILSVKGLGRAGVFEDVTFDLRRGEVLGFAGLIGSGRTDVGAGAVRHRSRPTAGSIRLSGKDLTIHSPREAMASGIAYVSEDRRQLGLSLPMSIAANISLPSPQALSLCFRPGAHRLGAGDGGDRSGSAWRSARRRSTWPWPSFPAATSRR